MILAGISHDLRTPLARMQLEVEMAKLSQDAREGMQSDIAQMDAIIGQFLDFAKPTESRDLRARSTCQRAAGRRAPARPSACRTCASRTDIEPDVHVMGNATDLRRVINNVIENARRYGKHAGRRLHGDRPRLPRQHHRPTAAAPWSRSRPRHRRAGRPDRAAAAAVHPAGQRARPGQRRRPGPGDRRAGGHAAQCRAEWCATAKAAACMLQFAMPLAAWRRVTTFQFLLQNGDRQPVPVPC